jgi:hypothetical protein
VPLLRYGKTICFADSSYADVWVEFSTTLIVRPPTLLPAQSQSLYQLRYGKVRNLLLVQRDNVGGKKGPVQKESRKEPGKQEAATPVPKNIGHEIDLFVNQIDALAETLPLATLAIQQARTASNQQVSKFFQEEGTVVSSEGNKTSYKLDGSQVLRYQRFMRRVRSAEMAQISDTCPTWSACRAREPI